MIFRFKISSTRRQTSIKLRLLALSRAGKTLAKSVGKETDDEEIQRLFTWPARALPLRSDAGTESYPAVVRRLCSNLVRVFVCACVCVAAAATAAAVVEAAAFSFTALCLLTDFHPDHAGVFESSFQSPDLSFSLSRSLSMCPLLFPLLRPLSSTTAATATPRRRR